LKVFSKKGRPKKGLLKSMYPANEMTKEDPLM